MTHEELNAEVTVAILRAEHHTREAVLAWERVKKAEQAIVDAGDMIPETERQIAERGVGFADETLLALKKIDRFSDSEGANE